MNQENKDKLRHLSSGKGTNQVTVGSYNERLVLQLVREHGELSKAQATRATGLSANAISVIFRSLEADGLLLRGEPIRGKVGQPSTPLRINPDAHHYVSLKIGRRSMELAVVNFIGEVLATKERFFPFPTPDETFNFIKDELQAVLRSAKKTRKAISGMAVAMPFELWHWTDDFGAPVEEMAAWRDFDAARDLGNLVPWDVVVENDATAACRAEVVFGRHVEKHDWIYFYVGTFIGGGIVLNGRVFPGRRGNAGGFGPMRVPDQEGGNRLVDHASLVTLERAVAASSGNAYTLYEASGGWDMFEPLVSEWVVRAGRNIAHAIVSSLAVIDFEAVVIDGAMPADVRNRLVSEVVSQLRQMDLQGVLMPDVEAGKFGRQARIIGAAAALISAEYLI
ncbi:ROK family protein [Celeribacter halophilus]|uniref:ROK family transcriptional regulator n=1 Tax=Celeribacter halophilus TaxID=576117 RepID=UPI003A8FEC9E